MSPLPSSNRLSRRGFIERCAVGLGASALVRPVATAATNQPGARCDPAAVGLAIATICTDGFANRRHEPAFQLIPQTGLRAVEFNLWYPEVIIPAYLDSVARRCGEHGLQPICLQGSAFGGDGFHAVVHDVAHKLWFMEQARRLGCRRVKFTGGRRGTGGGLQHVIAVCRELAPAAEAMGMLVLLENHANNVIERPEDYREIFSTIDSPALGLCLDTAHFVGAEVPLAEVVREFRPRIRHVDLKDNAVFGGGHRVVNYGEGVVDFDPFLRDLIDGGYAGYLLIEMAWAEPREPVLPRLIAARERFQAYATA
jgi:sugar phosphate isomerase/epimerase